MDLKTSEVREFRFDCFENFSVPVFSWKVQHFLKLRSLLEVIDNWLQAARVMKPRNFVDKFMLLFFSKPNGRF